MYTKYKWHLRDKMTLSRATLKVFSSILSDELNIYPYIFNVLCLVMSMQCDQEASYNILYIALPKNAFYNYIS